jgi:hypothetical protein
MKLKDEMLFLNHFEIGYLIGSIKQDAWDNMPRTLWLKLHIASTTAYLKHPDFGKRAREDLKKFQQELKELENGRGVSINV